jgi:hypothetical protein
MSKTRKTPKSPGRPKGAGGAIPCPGLRAAREARQGANGGPLTVKEAAESFGWQRTRWSEWERRRMVPKAELERVLRAWGLDLGDVQQAPEARDEVAEIAAELDKLGTALRGLSARVRRFSCRDT